MAARPGIRSIRIRKGDRVLHVHGALAGTEGVYLAKGQVQGIYDAPVKTTYKAGAFQEGSTHRNTKRAHRDMLIGFHVKETSSSYELNDSVLRQMFDYELDPWEIDPEPTTIEVDTELSGVRKLDVFMYEEPEFIPDQDPLAQEFGNVVFKLRAPDPMWYEDDQIQSFGSPGSSAVGWITVENPTDNIAYQKWIMTPAHWSIPDVQWVGPKGARVPGGPNFSRYVSVGITPANGGAVADRDRMNLMWRDANNTNILGQLGANAILAFAIPPYTPPTNLLVGYHSAPGGAMIQLQVPLRWSRPWGLELVTDYQRQRPAPALSVFDMPGDYMYTIPEWADAVDVVLLGGGGGGAGGWSGSGPGGHGGHWATATLIRGEDIPWDSTVISGVVGRGGIGSAANGTGDPGEDGLTTTASAPGMVDMDAIGGYGGSNARYSPMYGLPPVPQVQTLNGRNYYGGTGSNSGWAGSGPGSGGSGGWAFVGGYPGAQGRAWFFAYSLDEGS